MERTVPFTYLRLGDGELSLLISWQEGNIPQGVRNSGSLRPIFHAQGVTGIRLQDYPRILRAFEDCNYQVEQRARVLGFRVSFEHVEATVQSILSSPWRICNPVASDEMQFCISRGATAMRSLAVQTTRRCDLHWSFRDVCLKPKPSFWSRNLIARL